MPHRVMTLREVAAYLRVRVEQVDAWVRSGDIPFERSGSRVVFRRSAIEPWASARMMGFNEEQLREYYAYSPPAEPPAEPMAPLTVSGLIQEGRILPEMDARTRPAAVRSLLAAAEETGWVSDAAALRESVEARERLCSTALPGGVAIPHPLHHEPYLIERCFIVLGRVPSPIPFGSPDGQTTDLFFLLCSSDERQHLQLLARVCQLCHGTSLLEELRLAEGADAMLAAVRHEEASLERVRRKKE